MKKKDRGENVYEDIRNRTHCSQLRRCRLRNDCSGRIGRPLGCSFRSSR